MFALPAMTGKHSLSPRTMAKVCVAFFSFLAALFSFFLRLLRRLPRWIRFMLRRLDSLDRLRLAPALLPVRLTVRVRMSDGSASLDLDLEATADGDGRQDEGSWTAPSSRPWPWPVSTGKRSLKLGRFDRPGESCVGKQTARLMRGNPSLISNPFAGSRKTIWF